MNKIFNGAEWCGQGERGKTRVFSWRPLIGSYRADRSPDARRNTKAARVIGDSGTIACTTMRLWNAASEYCLGRLCIPVGCGSGVRAHQQIARKVEGQDQCSCRTRRRYSLAICNRLWPSRTIREDCSSDMRRVAIAPALAGAPAIRAGNEVRCLPTIRHVVRPV